MEERENEIQVIENEVVTIQQKIGALVITDERSSKLASDYGVYVSTVIKKAEDLRKTINEPYERYIKENNAKFSFVTVLKELKEAIRGKIMSYLEVVREKEKQEAEAKQKEIDKLVKENGLPPVPVEIETKRSITSGAGKSFTSKRWTWRIIDESKIPDEYWLLDEKKISGVMRAYTKTIEGISICEAKIAGIEFYQEESVTFKR